MQERWTSPGFPVPACHEPGRVLSWVCIFLYGVFIFSPLLAVAYVFVAALPAEWGSLLVHLIPSDRTFSLLLATVGYASAVAAAGMVVGILVASFLSILPRRTILCSLVILVACTAIPPYIHALAWNNALSATHAFLGGAGSSTISMSGWAIAWWVQLMALVPFACLISVIALNSVSYSLLEAAQTSKQDSSVFRRILVPSCMPVLAAGFGFLFLLSVVDYSVPSLFGADTYALDIFALFSSSGSPAVAFAVSLPLLVVTTIVLVMSQSGIRSLGEIPGGIGTGRFPLKDWPTWFSFCQAVGLLVVGVQILVLLAGIGRGIGSPFAFAGIIAASGREISFSCIVGVLAAFFTIPVVLGLAPMIPAKGPWRRISWFLVTFPLAMPAPLTGIGMIAFWSPVITWPLLQGAFLPVAASVARFAPVAVIILSAQIHMVDPALMDAARVFSRSRVTSFFRVTLPLLAPGLCIATAFIFSLSLGELGATLLVAPPGHATLTMKIYNYLHYGSFVGVSGLCAVLAAMAVSGAAIGMAAIRLIHKVLLHEGRSHD